MTIKELREMINLMQEHGLTELEIEKNGFKIRLKKGASGTIVREEEVRPVHPVPVPTQSSAPAAPKQEVEGDVIKSPMVGTFYAAPAPDADPYVSVGKNVSPGDVLCIIEAMKLMNEIKCELKGQIAEVLVENGQPVEFDQPLFRIKKS